MSDHLYDDAQPVATEVHAKKGGAVGRRRATIRPRRWRWYCAIIVTLSSTACLIPQLPNQTEKTAREAKQPLPATFIGDWDLFDCTPYGAPASAGKHANANAEVGTFGFNEVTGHTIRNR